MLLSTKWIDYMEEPMKYQALMHHFFYVGGWLEGIWGGRVGDGDGDGWGGGGGWVLWWIGWVC